MSAAIADDIPATRTVATTTEGVVAIAASFLGLAVGFPSSFNSTITTFILPLTTEFGWGRTVPSLMYFAGMAGLVIGSIWLGQLIERFGAPRVAATSGIALAAVLQLLSIQTGSPIAAVGLSLIGGALGAGTGVGLYVSTLPLWFDRNLGRALGFAVVGQSVGLAALPALTNAVIHAGGWRSAYRTLALTEIAITLTAVALLAWLARRARLAPISVCGAQALGGMTIGEALRQRSFWVLGIAIFLASAGVVGASIHIFPLYHDRGIAVRLLPLLALALGLGTFVGRVGSGLLLDHVEVRAVGGVTFLIGGAGVLWLAFVAGPLSLLSVVGPPALIGVALGAESDILAYATRRLYGLADYPVIYNRLLIAFYLGAVIGAYLLGWASDHMAEPRVALFLLAGSCVAAGVTTARLPSTRRVGDQWTARSPAEACRPL